MFVTFVRLQRPFNSAVSHFAGSFNSDSISLSRMRACVRRKTLSVIKFCVPQRVTPHFPVIEISFRVSNDNNNRGDKITRDKQWTNVVCSRAFRTVVNRKYSASQCGFTRAFRYIASACNQLSKRASFICDNEREKEGEGEAQCGAGSCVHEM